MFDETSSSSCSSSSSSSFSSSSTSKPSIEGGWVRYGLRVIMFLLPHPHPPAHALTPHFHPNPNALTLTSLLVIINKYLIYITYRLFLCFIPKGHFNNGIYFFIGVYNKGLFLKDIFLKRTFTTQDNFQRTKI
jgi:hypothetical protein